MTSLLCLFRFVVFVIAIIFAKQVIRPEFSVTKMVQSCTTLVTLKVACISVCSKILIFSRKIFLKKFRAHFHEVSDKSCPKMNRNSVFGVKTV